MNHREMVGLAHSATTGLIPMAMDFFERQDHARRQTFKLIVLFGISVAVIIAAVYASPCWSRRAAATGHPLGPAARGQPISLLGPGALAAVALGTTIVIATGKPL